ncbi:MAG: hypothetical protein VYC46_02360 [Pseudomonadota bacterium]|nr:hypothetical protein [Pseudomonadota bacterium]
MPKLYKSTKVERGLRIGLREPSGSEWFADMTVDRNKRTCRKIGLEYDPSSKVNKALAEKKAKSLYKIFKEESKNTLDINGWQINTFTFSLVLLWLTGLVWISLQLMGSPEAFIRPYLLTLHGLLIAPLFIGLGGLWAAHMPKGWKPEKKRASGLSLIFFLGFLSISGLLLYYLGSIYLKDLAGLIHSILGLILVPLVFWHYSKRQLS